MGDADDSYNFLEIKEFVDIVGLDRISILFYDGCYNWNTPLENIGQSGGEKRYENNRL